MTVGATLVEQLPLYLPLLRGEELRWIPIVNGMT